MTDGARAETSLARAEQDFWQAALRRDHLGLITAYLLHFHDGRFATEAARLFQQKTGEAWSAETAAEAAWRGPSGGDLSSLSDKALAGDWSHSALCDVNTFMQDIEIDSKQVFRLVASGVLEGDSTFRHGTRYSGAGDILRARRKGSLITYVMRAENDVTGTEVHIGVLSLTQGDNRLTTHGWEMNTAGTYCDLHGAKLR